MTYHKPNTVTHHTSDTVTIIILESLAMFVLNESNKRQPTDFVRLLFQNTSCVRKSYTVLYFPTY